MESTVNKHVMCDECWHKHRQTMFPVSAKSQGTKQCCYCGSHTRNWAVTTDDDRVTVCKGKHR